MPRPPTASATKSCASKRDAACGVGPGEPPTRSRESKSETSPGIGRGDGAAALARPVHDALNAATLFAARGAELVAPNVLSLLHWKRIRFRIQFARRIGPFTGRFGIKESTGGIGLDTHLLSNRFEIVQDLFGFGEEIRPRYRLWIGYEFIRRLWLIGGVDHVFLGNRATTSSGCSSDSRTRT